MKVVLIISNEPLKWKTSINERLYLEIFFSFFLNFLYLLDIDLKRVPQVKVQTFLEDVGYFQNSIGVPREGMRGRVSTILVSSVHTFPGETKSDLTYLTSNCIESDCQIVIKIQWWYGMCCSGYIFV